LGVLGLPEDVNVDFPYVDVDLSDVPIPGINCEKKHYIQPPLPLSKLSDVPQAQVKTHLRNLHYMRSYITSGDVCPPDLTSYPMTTKESDEIFPDRPQHS